MKRIILLESNQNHATITSNGICTTLPASMGLGGGYVPMIVVNADNKDGDVIDISESNRPSDGEQSSR